MTEEEEAIQELLLMKQKELDLVPYTTVWWLCCHKGCYNGTRVRDYGIEPKYWDKRYGFFSIHERWILCSKHWKFFKRLRLHYSLDHIDRRIFDRSDKPFIISDQEKIRTRNKGVKSRIASVLDKKPKKK